MDQKFIIYRVHSNRQVKEAKPPPSVTGWKGMGRHGFPSPTPCPGILTFLLTILMISLVSAQSLNDRVSGCNIDSCAKQFNSLRSLENGVMGPDKECVTLRTYLNCIKKFVRDCKGDINFLTVRTGVKNRMKMHNCSLSGRTVEPGDKRPTVPTIPTVCSYLGKKVFRHCGLFGDPHLSTFNGDFQTCKVRGAWPLVNNEFLTVQVTNDPVTVESSATATSKLTVMIKKNRDCASENFLMYQAQTDSLPGSFFSGHTHYGPEKAVELLEIEEGKHVEIHIRYIATTIIVRQIGRYFTFAIKMPEELVTNSHVSTSPGLCYRGCPASEQIDYQQYLASRQDKLNKMSDQSAKNVKMQRQEAENVCREAKVVDFYFDSCVFDLMTTGDKNFTLSALSALKDIIKLDPSKLKSQPNRTDLKIYDDKFGNSAIKTNETSWTIVFIVLLCLIFNNHR